MQIASADYNAMKQLKTFENKEELNNAIRSFLYHHKHELMPAAALTLKTISRFAIKIPGVCWTKIATLADLVGKAARTIHRALKQLEELGAIKRLKTIRKKGGYGHTVIVINKQPDLSLPEHVTSDVTPEMSHREEPTKADIPTDEPPKNEHETKIFKTKSFREKNNNDIRKPDPEKIEMDKSFVDKRVPKEFVDQAKYGFNAIEIDNLWNRVRIAKEKINYTLTNETAIAIDALKQTIKQYKKRAIRKDIGAYFYTTVKNMLQNDQDEYERELAAEQRRQAIRQNNSILFYDWLNE